MTAVIPVQNTKTVHCIIQEGIRYCESTPVTRQDLGEIFIITSLLIVYLGFLGWLTVENDSFTYFFAGIFIPMFVAGLIMAF